MWAISSDPVHRKCKLAKVLASVHSSQAWCSISYINDSAAIPFGSLDLVLSKDGGSPSVVVLVAWACWVFVPVRNIIHLFFFITMSIFFVVFTQVIYASCSLLHLGDERLSRWSEKWRLASFSLHFSSTRCCYLLSWVLFKEMCWGGTDCSYGARSWDQVFELLILW